MNIICQHCTPGYYIIEFPCPIKDVQVTDKSKKGGVDCVIFFDGHPELPGSNIIKTIAIRPEGNVNMELPDDKRKKGHIKYASYLIYADEKTNGCKAKMKLKAKPVNIEDDISDDILFVHQ